MFFLLFQDNELTPYRFWWVLPQKKVTEWEKE